MQGKNEVSIRDIQNKMLEILVYFHHFCQEHGLKYVLAGGSALGAVRHQGFIPWDDDVDVLMLREDYEKLQDLWAKYADLQRYSCVRSDENINIHHTATEIKDNNTTFINRHSVNSDINHGMMIDVIPLDGVPEGKFAQLCQMANSMLYCCFNFQRLPEHKGKLTYLATKIALGVFRGKKIRYLLWKGAERRLSKYGTKTCTMVASLGEGATIMRMHFPREWFEQPVLMDFAGHALYVPGDVDAYLKINFGDYMQLPPAEDQVPRHDSVFIDLENSYTKYKGIYYCVKQ